MTDVLLENCAVAYAASSILQFDQLCRVRMIICSHERLSAEPYFASFYEKNMYWPCLLCHQLKLFDGAKTAAATLLILLPSQMLTSEFH